MSSIWICLSLFFIYICFSPSLFFALLYSVVDVQEAILYNLSFLELISNIQLDLASKKSMMKWEERKVRIFISSFSCNVSCDYSSYNVVSPPLCQFSLASCNTIEEHYCFNIIGCNYFPLLKSLGVSPFLLITLTLPKTYVGFCFIGVFSCKWFGGNLFPTMILTDTIGGLSIMENKTVVLEFEIRFVTNWDELHCRKEGW